MSWTVIILGVCGAICVNAAAEVQGHAKSPRVRRNLGTVIPRITYLALYGLALGFAALSLAHLFP